MPNPLLAPSRLPYGLPDFASLRFEHYREAMDAGMAEQRAAVAAIIDNPDEPSFENTILALEASGRTLDRAAMVFYNKVASDSDDQLRALEEELAPELAAHTDAIFLDPRLFARVEAVHARLDELDLDDESRFLTERTWRTMQLEGAGLADAAKDRLKELNQQLSSLTTQYQKNLLADTVDSAVHVTDAAELDGLSEGSLSACAQAAAERGLDGYLVTLKLFTDQPELAQLSNRETRRRIYRASEMRCCRGNEHDNRALVSEITALRAERAALLGFPNHASVALADQTAGSPAAVEEIIYPLAAPVMANIAREAEALQELIDRTEREAGREPFILAPWDWSYYTEKLRAERFSIDTSELRNWFSYDKVLVDGAFWAATQLYGITFTERGDLVAYHPDARVFEVRNEDGSELGLFIHDVFARDSKRGGAWMNNLVEQSHLFGELPVVVNNLNVPKPAPGEPVLLSLDEVTTLFHEFGHALHGLFSNATYPHLAGTNVSRDFVEFPSQVNEMWFDWPEVINHYAHHITTGEPIDPLLLERMAKSSVFNQGFTTGELLASVLIDQEWHKIAPGTRVDDVEAFEREALERVGMANEWVAPRYHSTYFSHTFSGGYDAGYYSYLFSEILDADTVEWFKQHGGLLRANGEHFRETLLSRGRTREPMESFVAFRGREADITPLLKRRGLA